MYDVAQTTDGLYTVTLQSQQQKSLDTEWNINKNNSMICKSHKSYKSIFYSTLLGSQHETVTLSFTAAMLKGARLQIQLTNLIIINFKDGPFT